MLDFFKNTIRASNILDTDQNQCSVGPDLSPNRLYVKVISRRQKLPLAGRVKTYASLFSVNE